MYVVLVRWVQSIIPDKIIFWLQSQNVKIPETRRSKLLSHIKSNKIVKCKFINAHPPSIAKNGLTGFSKALAKYCNSFLSKNPEALFSCFNPTIGLSIDIFAYTYTILFDQSQYTFDQAFLK